MHKCCALALAASLAITATEAAAGGPYGGHHFGYGRPFLYGGCYQCYFVPGAYIPLRPAIVSPAPPPFVVGTTTSDQSAQGATSPRPPVSPPNDPPAGQARYLR